MKGNEVEWVVWCWDGGRRVLCFVLCCIGFVDDMAVIAAEAYG